MLLRSGLLLIVEAKVDDIGALPFSPRNDLDRPY